ncbi:MAG: dephospho-CoA kinase [Lentisphaeria bacterium]|jgi:dephospho-CoA kinase|nr:dephospho-CoA kinase [Lentisphaeria bacterium]
MPLIAVTGGIGAGKSTVLDYFKALGAEVLDADHIVHSLYEPGKPAYQAIVSRWGDEVLDSSGVIDRKAVAAKVFASGRELTWLNDLLHPHVKQAISAAGARTNNLLYCAVPLLFEVRWDVGFAAVVAVWCDSATQRQRLQSRHWSEVEIDRRLSQQLPMNEKLRRSDYGLITTCSLAILSTQCTLLHRQLQAVFHLPPAC